MQEILKNIDKNPSVFQYFNANPNGVNTNDCVVRAIIGVTGQEWEDVLLDLTKFAIKV